MLIFSEDESPSFIIILHTLNFIAFPNCVYVCVCREAGRVLIVNYALN